MEKISKLPEEKGHVISFSEHGNPDGPTIISFHGGPGSKSKPKHASIYDLNKYRVVLFDQRGCGESLPSGELEYNTTDYILEDAERIRELLNIEKWYVGGASCGSTLALLYAQKHKERINGLLLSSIWLADKGSKDWGFHGSDGVAQLMPDVFERRQEFLSKYKTTPREAAGKFLELLDQASLEDQKEIAAGVINWELNLFSPLNKISYLTADDVDEKDIVYVKIFLHYERNNYFIEDDQIINNIKKIENIPTILVHGRYDILCPMKYAYLLNKELKNSDLVIATESGHSLSPEGNEIRRLAFDRFLSDQSS